MIGFRYMIMPRFICSNDRAEIMELLGPVEDSLSDMSEAFQNLLTSRDGV